MKIAIWHNLPSGGGKRALYDHVKGLVARGHVVEAWCPPTADGEYLPLSKLILEHVVDLDWPKITKFSDKCGLTLEVSRRLASMDAHCRACAEQINKGEFDVLFANSCKFFRTTKIGHYVTIPSVLYLQEPYRWLYEALPRLIWLAPPRILGSSFKLSRLKSAIIDFRDIRNWRRQAREEVDNASAFNRILVNSYYSRESVLKAYGLDSEVCYLGIDVDHFDNKGIRTSGLLVGLGSFTAEKNVRICIEAIGTISPSKPKLLWIGNMADPRYLEEMQMLAEAQGVDLEVRIKISDVELIDCISQAIAMLYAPRLEPFGLAPLEANACGVPVIAVAEGGVRETIVNKVSGLLVDNTPSAMGAAISELLTSPSLASELGTSARLNVRKNWNIDVAVDRLERQLMRYARTTE